MSEAREVVTFHFYTIQRPAATCVCVCACDWVAIFVRDLSRPEARDLGSVAGLKLAMVQRRVEAGDWREATPSAVDVVPIPSGAFARLVEFAASAATPAKSESTRRRPALRPASRLIDACFAARAESAPAARSFPGAGTDHVTLVCTHSRHTNVQTNTPLSLFFLKLFSTPPSISQIFY